MIKEKSENINTKELNTKELNKEELNKVKSDTNQTMFSKLKMFNQMYKEMDIIHHNYAKKCGLSDMAYWILYSMAENDRCYTQRDFCREWFFPPQTVNSALKDLEKKDIIYLEAVEGNKKNKWIKLTENGKKYMMDYIIPIVNAECKSFEFLTKDECDVMMSATQKYVYALEGIVDDLIETLSD